VIDLVSGEASTGKPNPDICHTPDIPERMRRVKKIKQRKTGFLTSIDKEARLPIIVNLA
jgi:hypothetical protein